MDNEEERRLQSKLNETAQTLMDKKTILDSRDKLLRLRQDRQTDLSKAVAIVGTCPDMCPEQERYFRIETNQISPFEMNFSNQNTEGVPDETKMIKEYRRSGADQEEPLPHELRPIDVLERTMEYLCLEIVDQYQTYSNKGEWFDFIWSRTRSIRKDITQQHLIDLKSVSLVEKCARFHIFCSYYLFEEETKDFDPKINEENLNNCLQTLKDFYYDLSLRSIYCENESEFRAYDILLNIQNGETLSELKNFRPEIKNSPNVLMAIKLYQSFNSKNHVRFFQYSRKADFFKSCILNRYFNTFRIKSLNLLNKAFVAPKSDAMIPYSANKIIELLAFDDFDEFANFCDKVGLEYDVENIFFQRTFNIEMVNLKKRSKNLVLNKLQSSPGLAIMGNTDGVENFNRKHQILPIHSSFDNNNRLIFDKNSFQTNSIQQNKTTNLGLFNSNNFSDSTTSFPSKEIQDSRFPRMNSTNIFSNNSNNNDNSSTNFSFITKLNMIQPETTTMVQQDKSNIFKNFQSSNSSTTAATVDNNDNSLSSGSSFPTFKFNLTNSLFGTKFSQQNIEKTPIQQSNQQFDYSKINDKLKYEIYETIILKEIIQKHCQKTFDRTKLIKQIIFNESQRLFDEFIQIKIKKSVLEIVSAKQKFRLIFQNISINIFQLILSKLIESIAEDVFHSELHLKQIRLKIFKFTKEYYEQIFNEVLKIFLQKFFKQQKTLQDEKIKQWRNYNLQKKFFEKWRKNYLKRKRYRFYKDTFPAAPTPPPVIVPSSTLKLKHLDGSNSINNNNIDPLQLNNQTFIDDNFVKINDSLKRKLIYSKFNDTIEINRCIEENLRNKKNKTSNNQSPIKSILDDNGNAFYNFNGDDNNYNCLDNLEQISRQHNLEKKYFKKWLQKVRQSRRNRISLEFPSAPPPIKMMSSPSKMNHENWIVNKINHLTIIDPSISGAENSIRKNLLQKLNYDYNSTVSMIKQTLNDRRKLRQQQPPQEEELVSYTNTNELNLMN